MQFLKLASALTMAALASANTVHFQSQDDTHRTVYFTPNAGVEEIAAVDVLAGQSVDVEFPYGWIGNWYAVPHGSENVPGMLGEVAWNSWNGINFFDVSAIVNAADVSNVKEVYPASGKTPVAGCEVFPCNDAYYNPDDIQTKSTTESELICTLGSGNVASRAVRDVESPSFKRDFVLGRWSN